MKQTEEKDLEADHPTMLYVRTLKENNEHLLLTNALTFHFYPPAKKIRLKHCVWEKKYEPLLLTMNISHVFLSLKFGFANITQE